VLLAWDELKLKRNLKNRYPNGVDKTAVDNTIAIVVVGQRG
jgi:hypothetical protein